MKTKPKKNNLRFTTHIRIISMLYTLEKMDQNPILGILFIIIISFNLFMSHICACQHCVNKGQDRLSVRIQLTFDFGRFIFCLHQKDLFPLFICRVNYSMFNLINYYCLQALLIQHFQHCYYFLCLRFLGSLGFSHHLYLLQLCYLFLLCLLCLIWLVYRSLPFVSFSSFLFLLLLVLLVVVVILIRMFIFILTLFTYTLFEKIGNIPLVSILIMIVHIIVMVIILIIVTIIATAPGSLFI